MALSYNHSYLAYKIAKALDREDKFNIHIEITLDIDGIDYIPDIALYEKQKIDFLHDKVKAEEMPLLVVEILSPRQPVNEITEKFEVYLKSGIRSCWLVIPPTKTIVVFDDINHPRSYSGDNIQDSVTGSEVSVPEIFQ